MAQSAAAAQRQAEAHVARVWCNVKKMLGHRGYDVSHLPDRLSSKRAGRKRRDGGEESNPLAFHRGISRVTARRLSDGERLVVACTVEPKVGVKTVRTLVAWMRVNGVPRAVMLSSDGATPFTARALSGFLPEARIEIMQYDNFSFCLPEHQLVPQHEVLTERQKEEVLEALSVRENQLPKQTLMDPLTRYYGLDRGTIVLYYRRNGIQEIHAFLRIVD